MRPSSCRAALAALLLVSLAGCGSGAPDVAEVRGASLRVDRPAGGPLTSGALDPGRTPSPAQRLMLLLLGDLGGSGSSPDPVPGLVGSSPDPVPGLCNDAGDCIPLPDAQGR